ncbi:MAG TPA: PLP-dependent aminotransferase family protein [Candidatus Limnocylindria bacterium]|nr:PLP-dependent aminotransferase family protein [Candidatus Limnocylindria bacterium]
MDYRVAHRMTVARGSIIRDLLKLAGEPGMISLGGGSPDPVAFPAADIARICHEALTAQSAKMLQYGISEGYPALRETMRKRLGERNGMDFSRNDVLILSGGQQCADLCAKVFVNEGDTVVVEGPSFVGCMNAFRAYAANLTAVPLQEDGVDLAALEEAFRQPRVSLFYTIPAFQNPTGITTSLEKRKAVYALAQKYDVMILEDNPYGELRFEGETVPDYKSFDVDGRVVYASSFSKTLTPGLRVGYIVFDKALLEKFKIAKQGTDVHSSTIYQHFVNEYLNHCDYDGHIGEICALYREKRDLMQEEIKKHFHPAVTVTRPEGGFFIMASFPEGVDTAGFVQEAIRRKVIVVPGSAFRVNPDLPDNTMRLNFSLPSREHIVRGIGILGELTHEEMAKRGM